MSGHTKGPWRIYWAKDALGNEKAHQIVGIGDANAEGIADCGFGVWRGGSDEAIANATLIAAAPELLEALVIAEQELTVAARKLMDIANIREDEVEIPELTQIRAAIKKATGAQ